jgi:hypothetical protein
VRQRRRLETGSDAAHGCAMMSQRRAIDTLREDTAGAGGVGEVENGPHAEPAGFGYIWDSHQQAG